MGEARAPLTRLLPGAQTIARDYEAPRAVQGLHDAFRYPFPEWDPNPLNGYRARYVRLASLGAGVAIRELDWAALDRTDTYPTTASCPPSFQTTIGSQIYCYDSAYVRHLEAELRTHAENGIQSALVVVHPPVRYSTPQCVADPPHVGSFVERRGCAPTSASAIHLRSLFRYLASHFVTPETGRVSHFVLFNEVGSGTYFDLRPTVDVTSPTLSNAAIQLWAHTYASWMRTAHDGIADSGRRDVMLYASFDQTFQTYYDQGSQRIHVDNQYLLDALKSDLGVTMDWSIAIHPYGCVTAPNGCATPGDTNPNVLSFAGLAGLATQMRNWLVYLGATDPGAHPQSKLFASEQSYLSFEGADHATAPVHHPSDRERAEWICAAHREVVANPAIVAVTHNYFQRTEEEEEAEQSGGTPNQGNQFFYGLVPHDLSGNWSVDFELGTLATNPVGAAYVATFGNGGFGSTNGNYCCTEFNLGCKNPITGWVDELVLVPHSFTLRGWSCAVGHAPSIDVHLYAGDYPSNLVFVKSAHANFLNEPAVTTACGGLGANYRFEIPLTRAEVSAHQGRALHVFGISPFGGANPALGKQSDIHVPQLPPNY